MEVVLSGSEEKPRWQRLWFWSRGCSLTASPAEDRRSRTEISRTAKSRAIGLITQLDISRCNSKAAFVHSRWASADGRGVAIFYSSITENCRPKTADQPVIWSVCIATNTRIPILSRYSKWLERILSEVVPNSHQENQNKFGSWISQNIQRYAQNYSVTRRKVWKIHVITIYKQDLNPYSVVTIGPHLSDLFPA